MQYDPERISFGSTYTMTQLLKEVEYEGLETHNGMEAKRFSFDETSFHPALRFPMEIDQASGELYAAAEGGYVVHLHMTLSGINLSHSIEAEKPKLAEGTLQYMSDLASVNERLSPRLPEEALQVTQLPEDIPMLTDASQLMTAEVLGVRNFVLASDSPTSAVADFYIAQMPEYGWAQTFAHESAGEYALGYKTGDRISSFYITTDAESGKTLISIYPFGEVPVPSAARSVAESFLYALKEDLYSTAYTLCSPDLQAELASAEALEEWAVANGVQPLDWTFLSENVVDNMVQLLGTATFSGGVEAALEVTLIQVDGDWRVAGFQVG
jgi:hypothetical protein